MFDMALKLLLLLYPALALKTCPILARVVLILLYAGSAG